MAMISVNGNAIKDPSVFSWGLNDVSTSSSGRTQDATMHKTRVAQKRKISLTWWNLNKKETSTILKAFNDVNFKVTYPDALAGVDETRTFYRSDPTAPVRSWIEGRERYSTVSFDIIEV